MYSILDSKYLIGRALREDSEDRESGVVVVECASEFEPRAHHRSGRVGREGVERGLLRRRAGGIGLRRELSRREVAELQHRDAHQLVLPREAVVLYAELQFVALGPLTIGAK